MQYKLKYKLQVNKFIISIDWYNILLHGNILKKRPLSEFNTEARSLTISVIMPR